ncbi:Cell division protein FtsY-like [Gracilariopsis chorda]|uniref:Cell division protein FtsY-like n=1 Tax=Gracilariopsis chorda TaxID=448386 RepID=A0A2V3IRH8_9FLOR|nr:Cell division protein FtsY-like [Gracilariopsis chorda]|eukprot:PXF44704.1 Cell division protein FtsY-like [Gracilariopsis chorda]
MKPNTAPSFAISLPLRGTSFSSSLEVCDQSKKRLLLERQPRRNATQAVFDFVKKAGEEQKKAFEALRQGKGIDYVRDKVKRDIEQVRKFNEGLTKSREKLARDLAGVVGGGAIVELDETLEELEEVLIMSDLGVDTVEKIIDDLRDEARAQRLQVKDDIKTGLKASLVRILKGVPSDELALADEKPTIYMVIGANGMGKTTTIGKLATRLRRQEKRVLVAACDTFRAAAVDQLEEWVKRADADIAVPQPQQKSPSGVLYSAMERAFAEDYDYIIIDTSGRLHTNLNLMGELQKMVRVVQKFRKEGPDETLLVVDASIGRNAVAQAKTWKKDVGVSGLAVTKLDGTARAGFVVSCVDELKIPVKLVGVGEQIDDLRDFDPELFVEGLVG